MKKRFVGCLTALTIAALMTGCGSDADESMSRSQEETQTDASLNEEEEVKEPEVPLNELNVEQYVTLGDYNNISVTVDAIQVDEEEQNLLVKQVYISGINAENGGIVDRAVAVGDTVIIDYEGKKDGVAFAGGTAQGADLAIGSGQFIDGFEDGLVGVMPGETVDLNLTFPEGYGNAELAGQPVVFTVTVHYILPEDVAFEDMEDAVVAGLGIEDVNTVEDLKQHAYDYLYARAETNYNNNLMNTILDAMLAQCEFGELPADLTESYRLLMMENIQAQASVYGMDAETFANYFFGTSGEELAKTYAGEALKQNLALQAIANAEGLQVSDEELQEELNKYATEAGAATVEDFLGDNSKEDFRNYFMNEKVMDYLEEKVNITVNQ